MARTVIVSERSTASGVENPVFYLDKTIAFGEAKKVVEDIVKAIE